MRPGKQAAQQTASEMNSNPLIPAPKYQTATEQPLYPDTGTRNSHRTVSVRPDKWQAANVPARDTLCDVKRNPAGGA